MSEATDAHNTSIRDEFAHQADSFARSQAMSLAETLDAVVELVPEDGAARWAELACGPGLIRPGTRRSSACAIPLTGPA